MRTRQVECVELMVAADMRPITGRPSLFPRSHTHLLNSFPCGSPAIAKTLAWANNSAYHVPILAGPSTTRVYPVSTGLFSDGPLTTCSQPEGEQPTAYLLVRAFQQLWLFEHHEDSRGSSLTLCMRNLPSLHTARLLAVSVHACRQDGPSSERNTLSPELHTRRLPIAHVRVGNCWSYSRSRLRSPIYRLPNVTRQVWALPSHTSCRLRAADGDTCRTQAVSVADAIIHDCPDLGGRSFCAGVYQCATQERRITICRDPGVFVFRG